MFYMFLFLLNILNSTFLLFTFHPLSMGFILLIQTVLICLMSGILVKSFWFSYILFLTFLGGLLVLFIYVTSLASNEMFKFSKKFFIFFIISMMLFFLPLMFMDKNFMIMNSFSSDLINLAQEMNFLPENSLLLFKLFNFPINIFTILLMIYLFLTLIIAVKITSIFEGPLRPKL